MNKLINKNTITTKELAETLGVDKRTINETIQRLVSEKVLSLLVKISVKGGSSLGALLLKRLYSKKDWLISEIF